MKRERISGIYRIVCTINDKVYIGQSKDIHGRWRDHLRVLRADKHTNKHLQRAWNLYGEGSFLFEVIEQCELNELNEREIYYIHLYNSTDAESGYNVQGGGTNPTMYQNDQNYEVNDYCVNCVKECKQMANLEMFCPNFIDTTNSPQFWFNY